MHGYELSNFNNGKAFIHFDGVRDGKFDYGPRICINNKGEKLFELPDRDMFVCKYEDEDIAFVTGSDNNKRLQAVIDNKGRFLTNFIYNAIYGGSEEGLWEVKRDGKHGHIDITGREIIPCIYDDGCYFSEGIAAECLDGKWGMVDALNNTIIPFEYEDICICKNNIINAKKNGKYGLINKNNEVVADFLYDEIDIWCTRDCKVYPAKKDNKWGLIDKFGNVVEDFIYEDASLISENDNNAGEFIFLYKNKRKAIYSTKMKEFITEFDYSYFGYLSYNRFFAIKDGKAGFLDTYGETVIPFLYDDNLNRAEDFSEGLCVVYKDGKAGMIDTEGHVVIPFEYYKIKNCYEGRIVAINKKREQGILDHKGNIIVPFGKYCTYVLYNNGFIVATSLTNGDVYLNRDGEELEIKL